MIGLPPLLRRRSARRAIQGAHAKAVASLPAGRPMREGAAYPGQVVGGESLFNRADAHPEPTFTPVVHPAPPTRPIPGLATAEVVAESRAARRRPRPYVSAGAPKALLFDALASELPLPPVMSAGEQARLLGRIPGPVEAPGSDVMLYSGDGWAGALAACDIRDGVWEDPQAGIDQIATRTAASFTTARGHLRETLAGGWRSVRDLVEQAREDAAQSAGGAL